MRDRLNRNAGVLTVVAIVVAWLSGFIIGNATAAPVSVHVHQDNLYDGTRAEVSVGTTVRAKRSGMVAKIQVEPLDTRLGNWATEGPPAIARVKLHRGRNRIHENLSVEMLEDRFCAWQPEFAADHPECPRLVGFRDPYVRVPVVFNRVFVTVSVGPR